MLHRDERIAGLRLWRLAPDQERLMRIPDEVRKCTCFMAYDDQDGKRTLAGTASLIGLPSQRIPDLHFPYLVTAKHVIKGIEEKSRDRNVYARLNIGEGYDWMVAPIDLWVFHEEDPFVDVAALHLSTFPPGHDHGAFPLREVLTEDKIKEQGIGIGDEVVVVGLFAKHFGRKRNVPITRVGNIAAMPEEPTRTRMWGNFVDMDAYLIEVRSISGLSGSPVFVNLGQMRIFGGSVKTSSASVHYLLGLIHGHWDLEVAKEDVAGLSKEERETFNMGIAMVVPVSKIIEVLNTEMLAKFRQAIEEVMMLRDLPTLDVGEIPGDQPLLEPSSADSPQTFTREAFETALGRVSRRRPEPDEGTS